MSRFLGDKRIEKKIEDGDHIVLEFKDGSSDRLTVKMFEATATRDSTDLTNLWDRQLAFVCKDILQTLLDWDIKLEQLDYLFNMLKSSLEHNNSKAVDVLYSKGKNERRMSDIDRVLKSVEKNV